jgi:hypothetical protein
MICTPQHILFRSSNQEDFDGWCMCHVWRKAEVYTGFRWGDLRGRDHLEILGVDGGIILKWIFKKWDGCMG